MLPFFGRQKVNIVKDKIPRAEKLMLNAAICLQLKWVLRTHSTSECPRQCAVNGRSLLSHWHWYDAGLGIAPRAGPILSVPYAMLNPLDRLRTGRALQHKLGGTAKALHNKTVKCVQIEQCQRQVAASMMTPSPYDCLGSYALLNF